MKFLLFIIGVSAILYACSSVEATTPVAPPQSIPVVKVSGSSATTWEEYPAVLEGAVNVEIRPQVSGYLENIYVEEGAYVSKGQPLFKINAVEYNQYASGAGASIQAAKAGIDKAQIEVDRIRPLVENKVIAEVQLKTAIASLNSAKATYGQAVAAKGSADITVGYTLLRAPVSGYVGHIPFRQGSLIGKGEALPLTMISEVNNMHAYFSLTESEFLNFTGVSIGNTTEEKISNMPAVELLLPDENIYAVKGKIELVEGQFNRTSGTITFRAVFPNKDKLLRSGITGKIRIPSTHQNQLLVPQESTFEIQDKVFVFALGDSNKVQSKQISISGKSGHLYLVSKGLSTGETIVYSGIQRLRDGNPISPQLLSADSLFSKSAL